MIQCSRKPASAILLATMVVAVVYLCKTPSASGSTEGLTIAQLEVAIASPDASIETWMLYAQRLLQEKRFAHSAMAYQRALETDPYSRTANIGCATALALTGDTTRFYEFMSHLLLIEPRLVVDIMNRPEASPFLVQKSFHNLQAQAIVQSMD